jgi:pyruvate dehydrogenase E2 component (dihydrolipoamide acetyltransferase)
MANVKDIPVPDIGDFEGVEVIEIMVSPGDTISVESPLVSLESDKAAMEIPSPEAGVVKAVKVKLGDKVSRGDILISIETAADAPSAKAPAPELSAEQAAPKPEKPAVTEPAPAPAAPARRPPPLKPVTVDEAGFRKAHASPSVRKFARELGADLGRIDGSGAKGRILKDDVKAFIKKALSSGGGLGVAPMPEIDFSQFGPIETKPLTKINKLTGQFLHRNWVTVPHVTQFDEADVTELEQFRKSLNAEHKNDGLRVTILAFLIKALVSALKEFPRFNASLDATGENLVLKKYIHIGVAVDTPEGLVVPVLRDVDRKSLIEVAKELITVSEKARERKLSPSDMQGGCITISSLGGLGGTAFTPIVNAPEVAILGVSRAQMKPVYITNGDGAGEFVPRLILPLSLSYDHRVIDGADGARFTAFLNKVLSDTRRLLL